MYELYFEREKVLVLEVFYYPIQTTPKWKRIYTGCPKKRTFRMLLEPLRLPQS